MTEEHHEEGRKSQYIKLRTVIPWLACLVSPSKRAIVRLRAKYQLRLHWLVTSPHVEGLRGRWLYMTVGICSQLLGNIGGGERERSLAAGYALRCRSVRRQHKGRGFALDHHVTGERRIEADCGFNIVRGIA